jgi:uncharacterized protein
MKTSDFLMSIHDLKRQPGEMMEMKRSFPNPERIGIDVIAIEPGERVSILGKVESVSTGVLATCEVTSRARGECVRCLDPITLEVTASIQELFFYAIPVNLDDDQDEPLLITEEKIDLLTPIRDAVILDLPLTPHCSEQCLGLCPECGEKMSENSSSHDHEQSDPRWAALKKFGESGSL